MFITFSCVIFPDDGHIMEKLHCHIVIDLGFVLDQGDHVNFLLSVTDPDLYLFYCIPFYLNPQKKSESAGLVFDVLRFDI